MAEARGGPLAELVKGMSSPLEPLDRDLQRIKNMVSRLAPGMWMGGLAEEIAGRPVELRKEPGFVWPFRGIAYDVTGRVAEIDYFHSPPSPDMLESWARALRQRGHKVRNIVVVRQNMELAYAPKGEPASV